MNNGVFVKEGIIIPYHELEITTSRSGGSGGQHVNKTDSRITVRWNIKNTFVFTEENKTLLLKNLYSRLTNDGDLIINSSQSRSQQQNRDVALAQLAYLVRKALYVPKKRIATGVSKAKKEARLESKARRSTIKKMRIVKRFDD